MAKFQKGRSGNPKGKRPGTRDKRTILLERMLADDGKDVVKAIIEAAKGGDMAAARMILDRLVPVRRGRPISLALPAIDGAEDVCKALSAAIEAMASGEITPEEAAIVATVLDNRRKAIETFELEERISAIERKSDGEPRS